VKELGVLEERCHSVQLDLIEEETVPRNGESREMLSEPIDSSPVEEPMIWRCR